MCNTKWCYGECDECERDKQRVKDYEESIATCPHTKECVLITLNVKQDKCSNCGKIFNY